MNMQEQEPSRFSIYEAILKIIHPCIGLLTNCTFGQPVHPLQPVNPLHSEYLLLYGRKRLRIIHLKPNNKINSTAIWNDTENKKRLSYNSISDEYWFTRWSKPLKLCRCTCSFRQRQSISSLSQRTLYSTRSPDFKSSTNNIKNIEGFVEHLIRETFNAAFQESFRKLSSKSLTKLNDGNINLGFVENENDFSSVLSSTPLKHETKSCKHPNSFTNERKPIILLLHGIGDSADIWGHIINTFVYKGYEIVAPDMLGHGYSSVSNNASDYTFSSILQYTLAVFDHYIGCDDLKICIIVAHSYGCSLATALCQHRSQQIIQLILISGGGPTPLAPPASENEMSNIHCLDTLIKPLLFCGIERTILYPMRGKHFEVCNQNNGVPHYILEYIAKGQNWPEGDASFHRRILIPTLLVHGLQDNKIALVQECEMERTIPRAFLEIIPNAGHMCMLETPELLSHMIMCFIEWWSNDNFKYLKN